MREPYPAIDPEEALRNVAVLLQVQPQNYKLFGVWWWPIKVLLKRAGYTTEQLYMLGTYQDPETASMVPKAGLQATLADAFEEYERNATFPHPDGMVESPDGEMVQMYDEDADL